MKASYKEVVLGLVEKVLDRNPEDIVSLQTIKKVNSFLDKTKAPVEVVWIGGRVNDPIFHFWRLVKIGALASEAHVIFTGVTNNPGWSSLSRIYEGVKFGNVFFLAFNGSAEPPVVPSQRGLFHEGG